ncbi:UvrABC system protein B [Nymphon striatum]|nr:UvrABC system protein B [Nymphon striatum]
MRHLREEQQAELTVLRSGLRSLGSQQKGQKRNLSSQAMDAMLSTLEMKKDFTRKVSLRVVNRMLDRAETLASRPMLIERLKAQTAFRRSAAVEYFVSFYDYYQPEAYVARSDTFIEKESQINEQIDRMRHSATRALLERDDVIIVASVSCIYGIGSVETYGAMTQDLHVGENYDQRGIMADLIAQAYKRNDQAFQRGTFRVRGDTLEVWPAHLDDRAWKLSFFGEELENITEFDPLTGEKTDTFEKVRIYANSHYVTPKPTMKQAIVGIKKELRQRLDQLVGEGKLLEAQRLEQRCNFDLEMLEATGIIRPTGLLDPMIEIRPVDTQVDDVMDEIRKVNALGMRTLVTTLTKRMAEDLTEYLHEKRHQSALHRHQRINGTCPSPERQVVFGIHHPRRVNSRLLVNVNVGVARWLVDASSVTSITQRAVIAHIHNPEHVTQECACDVFNLDIIDPHNAAIWPSEIQPDMAVELVIRPVDLGQRRVLAFFLVFFFDYLQGKRFVQQHRKRHNHRGCRNVLAVNVEYRIVQLTSVVLRRIGAQLLVILIHRLRDHIKMHPLRLILAIHLKVDIKARPARAKIWFPLQLYVATRHRNREFLAGLIIERHNGLDALFGLIRDTLPERLNETAYALACDVAAADARQAADEIQRSGLRPDFIWKILNPVILSIPHRDPAVTALVTLAGGNATSPSICSITSPVRASVNTTPTVPSRSAEATICSSPMQRNPHCTTASARVFTSQIHIFRGISHMAAYQYVYFMDGVSKTYPGGKKVFENIRLNFLPGVKIGVVGVNGTGKSTLMRIMAGQDKEFSGEAWAAEGATVGYLAAGT